MSLLVLGAAVAVAPGARAAEPAAAVATVRAGTVKLVNGQVKLSDGKTERPVAPGDGIASADSIVTGADGSISVVLRDGTLIVVGPNSRTDLREFSFDATSYQGNMVVSVVRGTMRMVSGLLRKNRPDSVSVETPTALIGIRGTDFIVEVEPSGEGT
ncbi:FecR domain-containing protein [Xylophilus sp. GOD-11R]|uniref:FecR family protein n=1 Tax=Xylophilus sp. GOD-11R TaxID=3089814 RepID=UPI00298C1951|nr:FecR domain-containing protein [Xylophilus sp. GOD-11R]WPB59262.1 FecR domain-containing protein [Xylophilus sp. GOD-11R]